MMDPFQIIRGISFLFMTIVGILGNSLLLSFFFCTAYREHGLMASEVILLNLTATNLVMSLTRGLPNSLFILGLSNVFSDVHCQLLVYVSRISRAMSICLTCFLSCFQCVTLKSTNATCMHVKVWMQGHVTGIVVILFMMNAVMCISPLIYTVSGTNVTNMEYAFRFSYCIVIFPGNTSFVSNSFILFARDLVFVTGMSIASCSILHTLYRHGKQVKGIRNSEKSQSLSAEARASKTVSTLVSLYVLFFGIDNSVWFYQSTSPKTILTSTSDIRFFFSVSYSSVFPFVILFFNQKILQTLRRVSSEPQHSREDISVVTTVQ